MHTTSQITHHQLVHPIFSMKLWLVRVQRCVCPAAVHNGTSARKKEKEFDLHQKNELTVIIISACAKEI